MQRICFSVYGGKCLALKAVRNLVEKFSQGSWKVTDDVLLGVQVVETTVKRHFLVRISYVLCTIMTYLLTFPPTNLYGYKSLLPLNLLFSDRNVQDY
jgi:hypothetical protein